MADAGRKETDKLLDEMERKIKKEYEQAANEAAVKTQKYLDRFQTRDVEMRQKLDEGLITQEKYNSWRQGQIMTGRRWAELSENLAKDYNNANNIAKSVVNGYMPEVYALNHNYGTYEVEHQAKLDTVYSLYDRQTVERLLREDTDLLPPISKTMSQRIAEGKDIRWNKQVINSVMTQSILQGESIPKMARRLADKVGEKNYKAAVRNARTMTTRAENYGRLDSYKRAQSLGIELKKMWVATLDNVTRDSHVDVDGEVVPVDKTFSNGLDCPGGMGPPEEVYNCRCTMIADLKGFETDPKDMNLRRNEKLGDMSYDEWKQAARDRLPSEEKYRRAVNRYNNLDNPTEKDLIAVGTALRERMMEVYNGIENLKPLYDEYQDAYKEYTKLDGYSTYADNYWNKYNSWRMSKGLDISKGSDDLKWRDWTNNMTMETGLRIRIRGLEKNLDGIGVKIGADDTIFDVMKKIEVVRNNAVDKLNGIVAALQPLQQQCVGENAARALRDELGKIRSMGIQKGMDVKKHLSLGGSRSPMKKHVEKAYDFYPTQWINNSINAGQLKVETDSAARGFYSDYRKIIALKGQKYDDAALLSNAIHELSHRFERTQGLIMTEKEFYDRRTKGEVLEWLGGNYGKNEMTRKDNFISPYMGKDYQETAYELLSMGVETAMMNPSALLADTNMLDWIYGILSVR